MSTRSLFTLTCSLCFAIAIHAQSDPGVYSARVFGMAGTGATLKGIDAVYFNPAGLTGLGGTALHGGSGRSFGLSPLTQANGAISVRTGEHNCVFLRVSQFGFSSYQERLVGAGYALQLEERLSGAARFDIYQFAIDGYGSTFLPGFSLGIQYAPGRALRIGAYVQNPVEISTHESVSLPVKLSAGVSYVPSETVGVHLEIEKDVDFAPRVRIGVEYLVAEVLFLRAGLTGNPGSFHSGVGFLIRDTLSIDLGTGYHPLLGFTPVLGLSFTDIKARS